MVPPANRLRLTPIGLALIFLAALAQTALAGPPLPASPSSKPATSFAAPAAGRAWFHPAHAGKPYVNPDLTPERAFGKNVAEAWNGQLVLWQGRIRSQKRDGKATDLVLATSAGEVPIRFRFKAINLEYDRTGFRVAVKGSLKLEDGRCTSLDGHSLILLAPPLDRDYPSFLRTTPGQQPGTRSFLTWWVSFHNPLYTLARCDTIATSIVAESRRNQIDPLFLASLVQIESAFRVDAVSTSGAVGLGQLMPFVARAYGVDARDPRENLRASARMISGLVRSWTPRTDLRVATGGLQLIGGAPPLRGKHPFAMALAGYNAGPTLVRRVGGVPAIPQTTNYVYFIGFVHQHMTGVARRAGLPTTLEQATGPQ